MNNLLYSIRQQTCRMQLSLVFVVLIAIRVLFVLTYSPNVGGDAANYLNMLVHGMSNLIHASGYPFLFGVPWRGASWVYKQFAGQNLPLSGGVSLYLLIVVQHAISIVILYWAHKTIKDIYSLGIANWFVIIYGLHWGVMSATSHIYPQWLQADLLILCLIVTHRAYIATVFNTKMSLYAISTFIMAWDYLVKYNSIFFVLAIAIALLFDTEKWRQKTYIILVALVVWFSVTWSFRIFFHYPSTGTYTLSHDKAWVLLTKVGMFVSRDKFNPDVGINTKRLLLLNSMLPWDNKNVGPIANINQVSPEIEQYRKQYYYILSADQAVLNALLEKTVLVEKFNFFTAFSPVTYYLGLKEGNDLGAKVFRECVFAYPVEYMKNVLSLTYGNLVRSNYDTRFPLDISSQHYIEKNSGFYLLDKAILKYDGNDAFSNPNGYFVWKPGTTLFKTLIYAYKVPNVIISAIIFCGFVMVMLRGKKNNKINMGDIIYLFMAVISFGFIVFSNALFQFRWYKELVLVMPLLTLVFVISIGKMIEVAVSITKHRSRSAF